MLARILLTASTGSTGVLIHEAGFHVLVACARVSRCWRAATLAAAALAEDVRLPNAPGILQSPLVQSWRARGKQLMVRLHGCSRLQAPLLGKFLASCPALEHCGGDGWPVPHAVDAASFEAALTAVPGLISLGCIHYLPAGNFPASLQRLRLMSVTQEGAAVEGVLARLQVSPELRHVKLGLQGQQLQLRQHMLGRVQLPSLRVLEMQLECKYGTPELDLSWLAAPRSFAVRLEIHEWPPIILWEQPLQALQHGVLQSQDKLLVAARPPGHFSSAAQALLDALRLAGVSVTERKYD